MALSAKANYSWGAKPYFGIQANVEGRVEFNTDTWIKSDGGIYRAGVIRQNHRVIWFEAEMRKSDGGV